MAGNYQVEVFGFAAAQYRLIITIAATSEMATTANLLGGIDPNKPQPSEPPIGAEVTPSSQVGIEAPGVSQTQTQVFLPLVQK